MKLDDLVAIDVHTHAEVSCRQEPDPFWAPFDEAASKYFKVTARPTIAETLGITVANVEKKLYRARQALLERMRSAG